MSLWRAEFQQNAEKVSLSFANPAILLSAGLQSRATIQDNTITTSPSALRVASSEFVVRNVGNEALSISSLTCMMTWNQILLMRKVSWEIWMKSKILHSRTVEDDIISGICVPCQLRNFDMINVNRIPTAN